MKTILLLIPQGETQDLVASQLSADYQVVCCDQCPPEGEAAKLQDIAAVLVDLEHARNQGLTLAERLKDRSPFSAVSFLGLTFGLPREQDLYYSQVKILSSLGVFSALALLHSGQRSAATPPSIQLSQSEKSIPNLIIF